MSGVTIRGRGIGNTKRKLRTYERRVDNVRAAWPRVGRYLASVTRRQFTTKGAFLKTPWKPLKPEYRLWKVRNGYSRAILIQTGDMRSTFTSRPMDIEEYHSNYAVFGSSHPLARYHQYGTRRNGKRVLPARKILVTNKMVRSEVRDIVADYIIKGKR